jgi:hypothetical protein
MFKKEENCFVFLFEKKMGRRLVGGRIADLTA